MRDKPLRLAEALSASLVVALSATVAVAYVWGRVGTLSPMVMLAVAALAGVGVGMALVRRASADLAVLAAAAAVFLLVFGWLVRLALPELLPVGSGPDLTHHLMLIDYIEREWQLPDERLVGALGEMAHYTPGVHLLAALTGAWFGTDGLHTIHALVALSVALKCALVFLIALRILPGTAGRLAFALIAVALSVSATAYTVGSFTRDSFFAQVFAELFAVAMWWALLVWDERPSTLPLVLFAAAGIAAFLTWPVWVGPAAVALVAAVATRDGFGGRARYRQIVLALGPIAFVAGVHTFGRAGWLAMAGTSGAVIAPSLSLLGWPFAVLASAGAVVGWFYRSARSTLLLLLAMATQAVTLYVLARSRNATTPYMALKMMYLAVYPAAVLGALAAAALVDRIGAAIVRGAGSGVRVREALALLLLVALVVLQPPRVKAPDRVVSNEVYAAGRWAREHVPTACVDYLVPHPDTMYWLHLAVLRNPRVSFRSADPDTFVPARAIARWIEPGGLPYAIADLNTVPNEITMEVDVLQQFGTAAVVRRRGPSFCADAQRFAAVGRGRP